MVEVKDNNTAYRIINNLRSLTLPFSKVLKLSIKKWRLSIMQGRGKNLALRRIGIDMICLFLKVSVIAILTGYTFIKIVQVHMKTNL